MLKKLGPLRHAELRQGKDFSSTSYIRDNDHETFYLASIINDQVITCATFYPELTDKKHLKTLIDCEEWLRILILEERLWRRINEQII